MSDLIHNSIFFVSFKEFKCALFFLNNRMAFSKKKNLNKVKENSYLFDLEIVQDPFIFLIVDLVSFHHFKCAVYFLDDPRIIFNHHHISFYNFRIKQYTHLWSNHKHPSLLSPSLKKQPMIFFILCLLYRFWCRRLEPTGTIYES